MGELGGKDGAVARSGSDPKGQEEDPALPLLQGMVGSKSSRGGCWDLLGLICRGRPGAPHRSAMPATMLGKPSSPASAGAPLEQQTPSVVATLLERDSLVPCLLQGGLQPEPALPRGLPALL